MMEQSKSLRLMEIVLSDVLSKEIQIIRDEICCGCKVFNQDCLMMTEQEAWIVHGQNAFDRITQQNLVWKRFNDVMKILDVKIQSSFADHLTWLQTEPDQDLIRDLLQLYEKNHDLIDTINNLFNPPEEPLELYSECFFSYPPSYKYFVRETKEEFRSREGDCRKAYYEYMKSKLRNQIYKMLDNKN